MKKIISIFMVMVMAVTPLFSTNCFAAGDKTNPASISKSATSTNSTSKKSYIIKGLKITTVAALLILTGVFTIDKLELSDSIGKGCRFFLDFIKDSVARVPGTLSRFFRSFFKPSEVFVAGSYDVSCVGIDGSIFSSKWLNENLPISKQNICLRALLDNLRNVYNENVDLFSDLSSRYELVFKRV